MRDQGNTVIVVEHDEETMQAADYIVDFGPGPGVRGGEIVVEGSVDDMKKSERSLTGAFPGRRKIEVPSVRRPGNGLAIEITGATHHNLRNVTAQFPLGKRCQGPRRRILFSLMRQRAAPESGFFTLR